MNDEQRILTGLLWIATVSGEAQPSRYTQAVQIVRGVGSMRRGGVPESVIADAYRADLFETTALLAVNRWAEWERPRSKWEAEGTDTRGHRSHGCLILRGPPGAGKTAAVGRLIARRIEAAWTALDNGGTAADRLLARCKWVDCRGLVATDWAKINALDDLVGEPCLVLDDMSAAVANREPARVAFMALLGQRHEQRRLTIITSNFAAASLEAVAEAAVWSRVMQDGELVDCDGADLRATTDAAELDASVGEADRLAQLVRRLAPMSGQISDEVAQLPRGEAIRQLGRLLAVTPRDAKAAADEVDAHDARCDVLRAELAASIAGSIRRVAANGPPMDPAALELERARERRVLELLETPDEEAATFRAERERAERRGR